MDFNETMRELEALGTEQNRKIYRRHGMPEPLFGVSFGHLEKLRKRIKKDHALAEALWKSGNGDARSLAVMVAEPARMTRRELDTWARGLNCYVLADIFVKHVASQSAHAREVMEPWMGSSEEWIARAGWHLLAALASRGSALEDAALAPYLKRIEESIHTAQNRVRDAMNTALISIGARGGTLEAQALAAARRIGKVEVDHGETGCETPDAAEYILKMRARAEGKTGKASRAAKPAAKPAKAAGKPAKGTTGAKPTARRKTAERARPRA